MNGTLREQVQHSLRHVKNTSLVPEEILKETADNVAWLVASHAKQEVAKFAEAVKYGIPDLEYTSSLLSVVETEVCTFIDSLLEQYTRENVPSSP